MNYLKEYIFECELESSYKNKELINSLLKNLSEESLQILIFRYVDELTYKEIGLKMDLSIDAVRARECKSLRKLYKWRKNESK